MSEPWSIPRGFTGLIAFLCVSAAYLFTFPQPNVFYAVVVLLHVTAGVVTSVWMAVLLYRVLRESGIVPRVGWLFLAMGAIVGLILIKTGTPRSEWNWLYAHI